MAEYDLAIRGGQAVLPDGAVTADIAVTDGRIVAVGTVLGPAAREIDATGMIVMPGGVDPHVHIEQRSGMGLWNADSFETATRSAAMGGTTSVISFAAQEKGQRLTEAVEDYAARAARGAAIDHAFHLLVSDAAVPDFASDLAALIRAGHRSVKVFTTYDIRLEDRGILRVMEIAREAGALVCVHAETDAILATARERLLSRGETRPRDHARARPRIAEIDAVERICRFAEATGAPTMLFHLSCAEAVATVRAARGRGAPVVAETCPHYLLMTEAVLDRPGIEGAKWMCSPPQRTGVDCEALWDGLARGDLALVSSDHAPYRFDATGKLSAGPDAPFPRIANGLPGLETRMPLVLDACLARGLGPEMAAELTAAAPARLYGLALKGRIAPGMDADLAIWDPARPRTYGADDLSDNVGYNPWEGAGVRATPVTVLLRGEAIVEDGAYRGTPGAGRWLDRTGIGVAAGPGELP